MAERPECLHDTQYNRLSHSEVSPLNVVVKVKHRASPGCQSGLVSMRMIKRPAVSFIPIVLLCSLLRLRFSCARGRDESGAEGAEQKKKTHVGPDLEETMDSLSGGGSRD